MPYPVRLALFHVGYFILFGELMGGDMYSSLPISYEENSV